MWPKRSRSARPAIPSILGFSPSRGPSSIAAWALLWRAPKGSETRSSAPRPQPRASKFVMKAEGGPMPRTLTALLLAGLTLAGCNEPQQAPTNQPAIRVRSAEQRQLEKLDAFNLAIALKHAIYDAGYTCKRVTDAGFVGAYRNLDMWMAHCVYDKGAPTDWAIFAGP